MGAGGRGTDLGEGAGGVEDLHAELLRGADDDGAGAPWLGEAAVLRLGLLEALHQRCEVREGLARAGLVCDDDPIRTCTAQTVPGCWVRGGGSVGARGGGGWSEAVEG